MTPPATAASTLSSLTAARACAGLLKRRTSTSASNPGPEAFAAAAMATASGPCAPTLYVSGPLSPSTPASTATAPMITSVVAIEI